MEEKNKKQKQKTQERGITLIALVITIVILIILATVTLNVVLGEGGLVQRAQQAKELTEQAAIDEQESLNSLMSEYANIMAGGPSVPPEPEIPTMEDAKPNPNEDGPKFDNTTLIKDDLNNEVKIPGGFHLDKDSGTKVEEGIVIEDDSGNQFVWIPVGEYNVSTTINSSGKLTNELTRREWAEEDIIAEPTPVSADSVIETSGFGISSICYGEGDSRSVAKDQIEGFKNSSTTNKGFYIGRYEQGEENVCKAGVNSYNTTRDNAKAQAEEMYSGNAYITSELISSYAWDTALNFICQTNEEGYKLATTTDSAYGNINTGNRIQTGQYKVDGAQSDKYSNIYDLLGNYFEWTTEYAGNSEVQTRASSPISSGPCVTRGGDAWGGTAAIRLGRDATDNLNRETSFRIQLYINPES